MITCDFCITIQNIMAKFVEHLARTLKVLGSVHSRVLYISSVLETSLYITVHMYLFHDIDLIV